MINKNKLKFYGDLVGWELQVKIFKTSFFGGVKTLRISI